MRQAIPAPTPARPTDGQAPPQVDAGELRSQSWLRQNLEHSLPFILGGALCVGLAVWLHLGPSHAAGSRLSLWILLAAVGVTLAGGGLALTVVDEPQAQGTPDREGDYVMVARSEWEQWQSGGAPPPEGAPHAEPPQPWDETNPEVVSGSPSPPSAPTGAAYDPALVATVSEDLLRAQRSPGASGPTGPAEVPVATERFEAPQGGGPALGRVPEVPKAPSPAPARGGEAGPKPRPPIAPVWQEDAIQELESVLEQFGGEMTAKTPRPALPRPQASIDRCIACGAAVTGYSEQACVVCDRPLCDRCLERSVAEGRPAVCPLCPTPPEG
jgi:hypothetical protein